MRSRDSKKQKLCNLKRLIVFSLIIIILIFVAKKTFRGKTTQEETKNDDKIQVIPIRTVDRGHLNKLTHTEDENAFVGVLEAGKTDDDRQESKSEKYKRIRDSEIYKEKPVSMTNDYLNESLSIDERVQSLVLSLGLDELLHLSTYNNEGPTIGIESKGIKPFAWHTECLHGQVGTKGTAFPHSVNLAATFDPEVVKKVASAIGDELRAINLEHLKLRKMEARNHGLNCFAPVANIMRHPLWGRNQETYGEDPNLARAMIRAFITGIQGNDPKYLKVSAGCKHFIAHSGPESSIYEPKVMVSDRDFYLTFLPTFKECVEAGASTIMCTNHKFNGTPSCIHPIQKEVLRDRLKFNGVIVTEERAIVHLLQNHQYTNVSKAAYDTFKNGVNLENAGYGIYQLKHFIRTKELTVDHIRKSVAKLFRIRMKLGEFDRSHPYKFMHFSEVQHEEHNRLSLEAAMKSIVLLKNEIVQDKGFLPLSGAEKLPAIILIGPFINNLKHLFGNNAPHPDHNFAETVHDGIVYLANKNFSHTICNNPSCADADESQIDHLLKTVFKHDASLVFLTLGTGSILEDRQKDRRTLDLPENQQYLLKKSITLAAQKKIPIVLLLFSGGPLNISMAVQSNQVKAILACFYPGQRIGSALYRILTNFGENSVPSGRLPFTWHANDSVLDSIDSYDMQVSGHTYRYFRGEPLFPFGYGLSYSKFFYYNVSVYPSSIKPTFSDSDEIDVTVVVKNIGKVTCDEIVQVYVEWLDTPYPMPNIQLAAFKRVKLPIPLGRPVSVSLRLKKDHLSIFQDKENGFKLFPGRIKVYAGGVLPKSKFSIGFGKIVSTEIIVKGIVPKRKDGYDPQTPKNQYQLNPNPLKGVHAMTGM